MPPARAPARAGSGRGDELRNHVAMSVFYPPSIVPPTSKRRGFALTLTGSGAELVPGASDRLAAALSRGDRSAFEQLYRRHGATTFAYLRNQLRDRAAAEDVQQQVWLEVWERRSSFDPALASFLTWAMLITRSRAIDDQRRRRPEPRDPQSDLDLLGGASESATEEMLERWRLADALRRLPHEQAEMLRLRFHDGLSQREISERTGVALGTVKHRMVDGLSRLRGLLAEEEQQ